MITNLFDDTICAISTAPGVGGIAVARVSGPGAFEIVDKVWTGAKLVEARTHTLHYGGVVDPATGEELDRCVASVFRAPGSFTGEDTVELSIHGSRWLQAELVRLLVRQGCRVAEPGEFTRRAFANGKLDLAEAEAVADVIASTSRASHRLAESQLRGEFSRKITTLRDSLVELAALLELELDFSEEDVEFASRAKLLALAVETKSIVDGLADSFSTGSAIRSGVPVAIVGATNAGKSSLLNRLLGDERAIVSDIHGTTRDTIEETMDIHGVTFRLIDTAGIRATDDPIESLGIERSLESVSKAMVVVWVIDSSQPAKSLDEVGSRIKSRMRADGRLIVAANKSDLPEAVTPGADELAIADRICPISAKTGDGIDALVETTYELSGVSEAAAGSEIVISNVRHYEALQASSASLGRVIDGLNSGLSGDFVAQDLREALHHLSSITGAITTDTLLSTIFSRFCIGK